MDNYITLSILVLALIVATHAPRVEKQPPHETIFEDRRIKFIQKRERRDPLTERMKALDPRYDENEKT